jgi:hypothetical protein
MIYVCLDVCMCANCLTGCPFQQSSVTPTCTLGSNYTQHSIESGPLI